jgi:hypothetical protein
MRTEEDYTKGSPESTKYQEPPQKAAKIAKHFVFRVSF